MKVLSLIILLALGGCAITKTFSKTIEVVLDGSGSYDLDRKIVAAKWLQLSGPASAIQNPYALVTSVKFTQQGIRMYELKVTDDKGATDKDTVTVFK